MQRNQKIPLFLIKKISQILEFCLANAEGFISEMEILESIRPKQRGRAEKVYHPAERDFFIEIYGKIV